MNIKRNISLGIIFLMCFVPFYTEYKYFNVTTAKAHAAIVAGLVLLGIFIYYFIKSKNAHLNEIFLTKMDAFLCGFAVVALFSSLFSSNASASFWGTSGWGNGAALICLFTILSILIANLYSINEEIFIPILIVHSVLLFIAILNAMGLDVLSLHQGIDDADKYIYLSFFGNANQLAIFLGMTFPMFILKFMKEPTKNFSPLEIFYIIVALFGIDICASQSIFLAIYIFVILGMSAFLSSKDNLKKSFIILLIYGIVSAIVSLVPAFDGIMYNADGMYAIVFNPIFYISIVALSILGLIFVNKNDKFILDHSKMIVRILRGLLIAVGVVLLVITVINFSDDFGTGRGGTWRLSLEIFGSDLTFSQKLFGVGPEMLYTVYDKVSEYMGATMVSAHSQPIQLLLTTGIFGLVLWLGFIISVLIDFIKNKRFSNEYFIPLACYVGTLLVNTTGSMNYVIAFTIYALYRAKNKEK